jgi:GT2 family glycosyltransferase
MCKLSIIIPSYNTREILCDCLKSIVKFTKGLDYEIIVIDNASSDGSLEALTRLAKTMKVLRLIRNKKNIGFSAANNQGYKASCGEYILFLNSDTKIGDNVLASMVLWMDRNPKVGVSSCKLKNSDGSIQATGGYFPTLPSVFSWMVLQDLPLVDYFIKPFHPMKGKSFVKGLNFYRKGRELDWVTGAFFLTRREILSEVGGWDEDYFMYMEEVDLCFRIKKSGWKIAYVSDYAITHLGGASGSTTLSVLSEYKGIKMFYKKHFPSWQYPILRFLLKLGALGRMVLFGIIEGKGTVKIYAEAYKLA